MILKTLLKVLQSLLVAAALLNTAHAEEPLEYHLAFERWNTHLMDITIHAKNLHGQHAVFAIPYWAPGVYIAEEFATYVQGFSADDGAGHPLHWEKTDGQTWEVSLDGKNEAVIHYQIYANGMPFRGSQYNDRHASLTGAAVWMYMVDQKERPITLDIDRSALPSAWKTATGLTASGTGNYIAANYDSFADCPIEISNFVEKQFVALGTTYHVVVDDETGNQDFSRFVDDLHKSIESGVVPLLAKAVGGPLAAPFPEYWFLIHITRSGFTGAGVEHLNSTMIIMGSQWNDRSATDHDFVSNLYDYKISLATHEFFHAWNVKRLRPRELGPFDYSRPVHTQSLWISEGLTDYYTDIALLRAGFWTPDVYLKRLGRVISSFEQFPGRKERSIADTSWDTWFGFRGGGAGGLGPGFANNLVNTSYSYYDGGQILGLLLDLEIRQATHNTKSLDDWMSLMYSRYALPKPGFEPQDAVQAASEIAGKDMSSFFKNYVTGKQALPYDEDFGYAGLKLKKSYSKIPWTGLELGPGSSAGFPQIVNIIHGSPAEKSGFDRGDVLVAVNDKAINVANFDELLTETRAGESVTMDVMRRGNFHRIVLAPIPAPYPVCDFEQIAHPSDLQQSIYRSMMRLN